MFAQHIWRLVLLPVLVASGSGGARGSQVRHVHHVHHVSAASTTLTYALEALIARGPGAGVVGTGPITLTVASDNSFTGTAVLSYNTTPPGPLHLDLDGVITGTVLRMDFDYGKLGYAFAIAQIDPTAPVSGTYTGAFVGPLPGDGGAWYLRPR